jgi:hypothetical protein
MGMIARFGRIGTRLTGVIGGMLGVLGMG